MTRVLVVCIGNAGRSQMAAAFLERARFAVRSAGTRPASEVHANVIAAMDEVGVDLSDRVPRRLEQTDIDWAELVVTMGCGDECPVLPGKEFVDWPLADPARASLEQTRSIRDEIERRVARLVADLRVQGSGYRREGFARGYDASRPRPPGALLDLLCRYAEVERPRLVVDVGSGTGLSSAAWADRAERVVGIEPNPEMRRVAEDRAPANVRYLDAVSSETGLPEAGADVVTASQSLHWMEAGSALAEAARILRPGGVFAAYDYDWPPVVHPDVDAAFQQLLEADFLPSHPDPKKDHLQRIRASGHFRYARELELHSLEAGDADRVVGLAESLGPFVQDGGARYEALLAELSAAAEQALGAHTAPFLFSYRVRLGVR